MTAAHTAPGVVFSVLLHHIYFSIYLTGARTLSAVWKCFYAILKEMSTFPTDTEALLKTNMMLLNSEHWCEKCNVLRGDSVSDHMQHRQHVLVIHFNTAWVWRCIRHTNVGGDERKPAVLHHFTSVSQCVTRNIRICIFLWIKLHN